MPSASTPAGVNRATLIAVGPSQHFIMVDQPDRFHALLLAFLADPGAR